MTRTSKSDSASVRKPLTAERLRELVRYEPTTGSFVWIGKPRRARWRVPVRRPTATFGWITSNGYASATFDGAAYGLHRIAWLYMTGEWPTADVDHINGNRTDNRWANLRAAERWQNNCNSKRRHSRSGFRGVWRHGKTGKWVAAITRYGRNTHLGLFETKEAAAEARRLAALVAYGPFARFD